MRSRRRKLTGRLWAAAVALAWLTLPAVGALPVVASSPPGSGSAVEQLLPGASAHGPLADIPAGHWVYRSLEELIAAGVVVEYSPGLLDGRHTISRYEAAMLLVDGFRRADAVAEASGPGGAAGKVLSVEALMVGLEGTHAAGGSRAQRLRTALEALGRELASELAVLGYVLEEAAAAGPGPTAQVALQFGPPATTPPARRIPGGDPDPASGGNTLTESPSLGAAPNSLSYRLGLSVGEPGRFGISGLLPVGAGGPAELGALMAMPDERWLWARLGPVEGPAGSAFAVADDGLVGLQGIEAHLVGRDGKTGVLIARDTAGGPSGEPAAAGDGIAAVGSSLVLSRDVVVGATIVRGMPGGASGQGGAEVPTVTSLTTRLRPRPWLTLTGEYAQNLWALPVLDAAMRLDATLQLGDVRLGARVGNISPDFRPVLGQLRPGALVGLDTAVRMGEVELRAGTSRLDPADGGGQEIATAWGVTLGSVIGPSLQADFERVSVQELSGQSRGDRSRTTVRLDWGTETARLSMGVAWVRGEEEASTGGASGEMAAEAAISYQLHPGAAVVFGYRLIDFGSASTGMQSNASAQITLRF